MQQNAGEAEERVESEPVKANSGGALSNIRTGLIRHATGKYLTIIFQKSYNQRLGMIMELVFRDRIFSVTSINAGCDVLLVPEYTPTGHFSDQFHEKRLYLKLFRFIRLFQC